MMSVLLLVCLLIAGVPDGETPERPSPARVRKTMWELAETEPALAARAMRHEADDYDALALFGDHEFLMCGGAQVGAIYRRVLRRRPDHVRANLGLGEWLVTHGPLGEAVPFLVKARDLAARDSPEREQATAVLKYVEAMLARRASEPDNEAAEPRQEDTP